MTVEPARKEEEEEKEENDQRDIGKSHLLHAIPTRYERACPFFNKKKEFRRCCAMQMTGARVLPAK